MTGDPLFRLEGIRRGYGGAWRLEIPSLEVHGGELLGLIGPTGAGKTTLLRLLHLLDPVEAGRVDFAGRPVGLPGGLEVRRQIGMVFQRPRMLSGTVRHNIGLGLRLRGLRQEGRVDALIEQFDLKSLAGRDARTLSGGEMQRLALARALAYRPRVLLLDEPAVNLDPGHAAAIEGIIREIHRRAETTIVMATHNLAQARRLTQRVAFLAGGRLVETGPTRDLFRRPRQPLTAAYLRGGLLTTEDPYEAVPSQE